MPGDPEAVRPVLWAEVLIHSTGGFADGRRFGRADKKSSISLKKEFAFLGELAHSSNCSPYEGRRKVLNGLAPSVFKGVFFAATR